MAYCVNCGVKLGDDLKVCPLCHTPVVNPADPHAGQAEPFFATRPTQVAPVSKRDMAMFITVMLASVSLCCGVVDLLVRVGPGWSLYVAGAAAMLWAWLVPPLLVRHMPVWAQCLVDSAAVGAYLFLIATRVHGARWYWHLALPVVALTGLILLLLSYLLRGRSILTKACILLGALALYTLGLEAAGDLCFYGAWSPSWSVVVAAVSVGLIVPLVFVRRIPSLREEARRRFHI